MNVCKTYLEKAEQIIHLAPVLDSLAGRGTWNFDPTDCDRILRIISDTIKSETSVYLLSNFGFVCCEQED